MDFDPPFANAYPTKRMPNSLEIEQGYGCGPLDLDMWNGLMNGLYTELGAVLVAAGIVSSNGDFTQIMQAIRSQAMNYKVASGTANALVVTLPGMPLLAYVPGLPLRLLTGAAPNTGAMTVNVDGLGVKSILRRNGTAMTADDVPADSLLDLVYDGTAFRSTTITASDIRVAKTPFNQQKFSQTTRQPLSLGVAGYVPFFNGVYVKKSATSELFARFNSYGYASSGAGCSIERLTVGAQTFDALFTNTIPGLTGQGANGWTSFTGLAAGNVNWTLSLGNPGSAWASIVNPTSADVAYLPAVTTTRLEVYEIEP